VFLRARRRSETDQLEWPQADRQAPPRTARSHAICAERWCLSCARPLHSRMHRASTLGCTGRMPLGWQNSGACARWRRSRCWQLACRRAAPPAQRVLGQMPRCTRCVCNRGPDAEPVAGVVSAATGQDAGSPRPACCPLCVRMGARTTQRRE
jgi:hypothetical protein